MDTAKVNAYNKLADQFKEIHPDSTAFYAEKAIGLSQKIHYDFGIAAALMNKGNSEIIFSNYPKALIHFTEAQRRFQTLLYDAAGADIKKIKNGQARAYASIGVVFSEINNYPAALENYFKALAIYHANNQKNNISKAYNNIGIVYKSQQKPVKALEYFKKALAIQQQIGEPTIPVTLTNIGVIYFELGKNSEALQYYNKAQTNIETTGNSRGNALLQTYFGDYYSKQSDVLKALNYYKKSLQLYEELGNKFGAALALYNIGRLHTNEKKYNEALPFVTKSLELAKEIGVLDQTTQSEKLLSELYGYLNKPVEALAHYKQYTIIKDSLNNEENSRKFIRAEMKSEYEKKEAILHEKNEQRHLVTLFSVIGVLLLLGLIFVTYNRLQIKRRLTLQKEVAEYEQKALHLQMNPHFVFNCLGSISSFIVQNGTDSAIKYLSKFSKLMRLTLEYSKGALIPVDKEIESLQNYLELEQLRFNDIFEFSIRSGATIEDDMALPPLLIQPFVENAILHGVVPKENNGKIAIDFNIIDNQLVCTIADDGIGFSKSRAIKEHSVKAHQSMALEITKKRLEIIEATTSKKANVSINEIIKNGEVSGTKVTLTLPIQYIQS